MLINHWKPRILSIFIFFRLFILLIILLFVIMLKYMILFTFNLNRTNNLFLAIKNRVWDILGCKNRKSGFWISFKSRLRWNSIRILVYIASRHDIYLRSINEWVLNLNVSHTFIVTYFHTRCLEKYQNASTAVHDLVIVV